MNNRLYCTFTNAHDVEETLNDIQSSYVILFNKIFILESLETQQELLAVSVKKILKSK